MTQGAGAAVPDNAGEAVPATAAAVVWECMHFQIFFFKDFMGLRVLSLYSPSIACLRKLTLVKPAGGASHAPLPADELYYSTLTRLPEFSREEEEQFLVSLLPTECCFLSLIFLTKARL